MLQAARLLGNSFGEQKYHIFPVKFLGKRIKG